MLGAGTADEFGEFDGYRPPALRSQVDEFTADDAKHVLDYDPDTEHGGHRYGSVHGGDVFPPGWVEADVVEWVCAVVDGPADAWPRPDGKGFTLRGSHRGVVGVVNIRPTGALNGWYISTAYPRA